MNENVEKKSSSFFRDILKFALIAVVIVIPFRMFVAQPFIVSGASMDPTFEDGEYLIVDQLSYHFEDPSRGDVIIFKYPKDTTKYFIKRVIGLPGETVTIHGQQVTISGGSHPQSFALPENYVAVKNERNDDFSITLRAGEFFVLGDNRLGSLDSRAWGPVPEKLITGRPLIRVLPFARFGFVPGEVKFSE